MHQSECSTTATRRPIVDTDEIEAIARAHGAPIHRSFKIQADDYIRAYRWRADSDRRAEVVFAIEDPQGRIWLHAKAHYPSHIFRLPSGGVAWEESILTALYREIEEETSLATEIKRFVGIIEYQFVDGPRTARFASYIFHLAAETGMPVPHSTEQISEFRAVLPGQLAQVAADLRNLIGDRRGWGQWRALAHDLVYRHLTG